MKRGKHKRARKGAPVGGNRISQWARSCTSGAKLATFAITHPAAMIKSVRYVFVFSHMRSRSTLLTHILGSHPEISGYVETHICYQGRMDFMRLRKRVSDALNGAPLSRIVMDKVLHNWYIDPALAKRMNVLPIFLARRPEEALPSICGVVEDPTEAQRIQHARRHYLKRMNWMENAVDELPGPAVFIESADVINRTSDVLRLLEGKLELSTPLDENYKLFKLTGQPYSGDPSDVIRAGQIVREARSDQQPAPVIPPDMLAEAQVAYDRCVNVLRQRCRHLDDGVGARPVGLNGHGRVH